MTTTHRSRPVTRGWAAAATAGFALTSLVTFAGPAGAETFIDPNDRCLPGADAPPAPASDRDEIAPTHVPSVDCAYAQDVTLGTGDGTYDPLGMTTRSQMASFIVRSLEAAGYDVPDAGDQGFTDIEGNEHEDNINRLAAIGIVMGKNSTTYAPQENVRRDQMASFIVRAAGYAFDADMPETFPLGEETPPFTDVLPSNTHADNINSGAQVIGLINGTTEVTYEPTAPVQRQQMASFLVRLVDFTLTDDAPEGTGPAGDTSGGNDGGDAGDGGDVGDGGDGGDPATDIVEDVLGGLG